MILSAFLSGAVTMGFFTAAMFLLRFWRDTGDTLFLAFALAFILFALGQALLTLSHVPAEQSSWLFIVRLVGFALILGAIVRKNTHG